MPKPFEEFRYSGCGVSSHGLQPIVLCLWLPLSFDLELLLCLVSGADSVIFLETAIGYTQIWFRTSLEEYSDPARTILPGLRTVLNVHEGGLCLCPPGVQTLYLIFSEPFPRFRVKMLIHFEDFLECNTGFYTMS